MHQHRNFPLGSIEGFFGKSWSWGERLNHLAFLARENYNFYIYAPKSDRHLRSQWQQDWPSETKASLHQLGETCQSLALDFGLGLSPMELYLAPLKEQRHCLAQRIKSLNELKPDILCILFDDMRGDIPALAQLQLDLVHQAAETSKAKKIIFCPTYYSFDPVLEKVFGQKPSHYWETLAQKLDPNIEIFWTGEKVCSPEYSRQHLQEVTRTLGRQPFLWDNYPVNDGAIKSKRLHLRGFPQSHSQLAGQLAGHAVNPMNQAYLSQVAMASLALAYRHQTDYSPEKIMSELLQRLCGEPLARLLARDTALFQDAGLDQLSLEQQQQLSDDYRTLLPNPYAQEVLNWLQGDYQFDPACLTE